MPDPNPISQDLSMLYQLLTPEVGGQGMAERIAAQRMAQAAARNRRNSAQAQSGDIPAIPDPINTNKSSMFGRAWGSLPDLPASNASSGSMDEYAPRQRPGASTARAVTALDEPWSPTQSQNTMDQGIAGALAAQGHGAAQQGMPLPKPRPGDLGTQVASTGGGMPGIIKASYDLPASDGAAGKQAVATTDGEEAQQPSPQQYGPPAPSTRDLLYDMAMSGRQGGQQSQTGNMENIALALMMGGFGTMAEASKPGATAMGSFGGGNTQGLQTLTMLNQLDQRNQRYKTQDHLGALRALANIENAQATRDNTAAYQDAMLKERAADRGLREQMFQGNQASQAAQLASMDAYRKAMLSQRSQELAATQDGVTPEMKRFQWIQDRALKEAQLISQETDGLGNTTINPEKMRQNYESLLSAYISQFGSGGTMPLPDGAPEGGFWSHDDKGQLRVFLKKDGRTFMWDPDKKKDQADE